MIIFSGGDEFDKILLFTKLTKEFENNKEKTINFSYNLYQKKVYKLLGVNSKEILKNKQNTKTINFNEDELEEIFKFESNVNSRFNKNTWKEAILKFLKNIEIINEQNKIKICVLWNNSTLYERALYVFCKKYNINYYILEQGYFRPITLAFDKNGVNAEASIIKEKEYYDNIFVDEKKYKDYLFSPLLAKEKKIKLKKIDKIYKIYKILDCLKVTFKLSNNIVEKDLIEFLTKKYKEWKNKRIKIEKKIEGEYIFIPFQVETDSQIILNSQNIKKMKILFEVVSKAVMNINLKKNKQIKAVFKTHPLDLNLDIKEILEVNKKYKDSILITEGDTKKLIQDSKMVITINSTVGIEALCEYKPVITLGESFYDIEGIAYHVEDLSKLDKIIERVFLDEVNEKFIKKFLYYLRFDYFKEIYWRTPDDMAIKKIVNEVLNESNSK